MMNGISPEFYFMFGVGIFLLLVVGIQLYFNKVYTRGRRGFKWHEKSFISKEEAPVTFWVIIGLQSLIGLGLIILSWIGMFPEYEPNEIQKVA